VNRFGFNGGLDGADGVSSCSIFGLPSFGFGVLFGPGVQSIGDRPLAIDEFIEHAKRLCVRFGGFLALGELGANGRFQLIPLAE